MANRADWEMLQNSLQNLGQGFAQRRGQNMQHEQAMQRLALEQEVKKIQEARYNAQESHFSEMEVANNRRADAAEKRAGQDKIQAYIADPNNPEQGIKWEGTPAQFETVRGAAAKKYGKEPLVMPDHPKAGSSSVQHPYATHTIGASTFHFYNKADNDAFVADAEKKGLMRDGVSQKETPSTTDTVTETETQEPVESVPAKPAKHNWIFPDQPAQPAVVGHGKITRKTTKRVPRGGIPADTAPAVQSTPSMQSPSAVTPPQTHIKYLQQNAGNPKVISDFEQKYGAGSSAQYLQSPSDE